MVTKKNENSDKVSVIIRVRPLISEEINENPLAKRIIIHPHKNSTHLTINCTNSNDKVFAFDKILHYSNTNQDTFYDNVGLPMIEHIFNGFNSTIIAYGQTGSGKTYTVFGSKKSIDNLNRPKFNEELGLVPHCINTIFEKVRDLQSDMQFLITCSFVEIYLESLIDLFSQKSQSSLTIRESPSKGFFIDNLTEIVFFPLITLIKSQ